MSVQIINDVIFDASIRIIKEESCPSLSERTTLTYQIGCNDKNEILFRIKETNGTGIFNKGWHFTADMFELIYEADKPFSWKILYPMVKGRSVNSACFLMAILLNEGLLTPLDRKYEQKSSAEFQDRMKKLVAETKKKTAKKKTKKKKSKNKTSAATSEKGDK